MHILEVAHDCIFVDTHACSLPYVGCDEVASIRESFTKDVVEECRAGCWHQPDGAVKLGMAFVTPQEVSRVEVVVMVSLAESGNGYVPAEPVCKNLLSESERLVEQPGVLLILVCLNKEIHACFHLLIESSMQFGKYPINLLR